MSTSTPSVTPGTAVLMLDNLVTLAVTAEQTGGAYGVIDVVSPPGGGPPTLHTHPAAESFYVIEGTLTLFVGEDGRRIDLAAGESAMAAYDEPHTYRNLTDAPTRFVSVAEGDLMERFFLTAGTPVPDPSAPPAVDPADIPALVAKAVAAGETLGFTFGQRVG